MDEYEIRERTLFHNQLNAVENAPLADRREGQKDFANALQDPETIVERIGWILNGSYGQGAYLVAKEVRGNKRMNRPAWFTHTLAALDHNCPQLRAVAEYKKLSPETQQALTTAILAVLDAPEEE